MRFHLSLAALVLGGPVVSTAFRPSSSLSLLGTARASSPLAMSSTAASSSSSSSSSSSTAGEMASPFIKPPRVVSPDLPTVYVYDHCPFCVRVRFALGLKNIKHRVNFLANDDVSLPTSLVGKKIAPIFEWPGEGGVAPMAESLDIIQLIDNDQRLGEESIFVPETGRKDIKAWQKSVQDLLRGLQRPRYVATGLLPEFQQLDGRHAFIQNHPMPGYEKPEWKQNMSMQERLTLYAEGMAKDPAADIEELNRKLVELDDIIFSEHHCSDTQGKISYDDIDLFARLRSITIVRDVQWPTKLRQYMDNMSELGDVPLYDEMAL